MVTEHPPCVHCGVPTTVADIDTIAVCDECLREAAAALQHARSVHEQAGAQFVGRERGTRDDYDRSSGSVAARFVGGHRRGRR